MDKNHMNISKFKKDQTGKQILLVYQKEPELIENVFYFLNKMISNGLKCIIIKDNQTPKYFYDKISEYSNVASGNIIAAKKNSIKNNITIIEKKENYNNIKTNLNLMKKETSAALENGYSGLSIINQLSNKNEIEYILNKSKNIADQVLSEYPLYILNFINYKDYDEYLIKSLIKEHSHLIWEKKVEVNPYYINQRNLMSNSIVEKGIDNWLNYIKVSSQENDIPDNDLAKHNKYEDLLQSAPIGIVETTSDGKPLKINKRMAELLGFKNTELVFNKYKNLSRDFYAYPEKRDDFISQLKNKGEVKDFQFRALRKDGSKIWFNMNAKINKKKDDDSFIIDAYVFDITERMNVKENLERKKEELASYNEEILAINEELENSLQEIQDINSRFSKMINLFSKKIFLKKYNEADFLSDLLTTVIEVVPEADYGSVYTYRNGKVNFINTIGYELSGLQDLSIPEKAFFNKNNNIEVIDFNEVKSRNKKFMDENNYQKLKNLSYKMKEIMYMDLEISGHKKAGLSLDISEQSKNNFSDNSRKIFAAFYNIASSFYTIREYTKLHSFFTKELVTSIIRLLEMHDLYTKGHSENVANLASKIAKNMGLSDKTADATYWAGLVHDMGKLLIPLDVLNKTSKLNTQEYELIKEHPVTGSIALEGSDSLKKIAKYVRFHHERWDGKGYPSGIDEEEIPLISQILQVADSWDAMTSDRAYRKGLPIEKAIEEIKSNRGEQFSPKVVDSFLEMIDNNEIDLELVRNS